MAVLITGGARSGKSRFAEQYAARTGTSGIYIATSQTLDDEMRDRVRRHRLRRDSSSFVWQTVEEPFDLSGAILKSSGSVVLIDCLTLWLTNWLLRYEHEEDPEAKVMAKVEELAAVFAAYPLTGSIIAVTNEVGDGIVPEYPLGRQFRDLAGWMNQRLAEVCEEVFLVTAGIPVELKSIAYRFPRGAGDKE